MRLLRATALFALLTFAAPAVSEARPSLIGPYFAARFEVTKLPYTFGQAASWADGGRVLSVQNDSAGITQIYRSRLDGTRQRCLTCTTVKGPDGLPQERPEGDWILFESFGQQPTHTGGAGLGGYGGDLYVMRPDGSHPFRLTTNSDPDRGAPFTAATASDGRSCSATSRSDTAGPRSGTSASSDGPTALMRPSRGRRTGRGSSSSPPAAAGRPSRPPRPAGEARACTTCACTTTAPRRLIPA